MWPSVQLHAASEPPPRTAEVSFVMAATALKCRECGTQYGLEARYVCEQCFGPLEVVYRAPDVHDVGELRRKIQGGPQNVWRYADFLPLESGQPGSASRNST